MNKITSNIDPPSSDIGFQCGLIAGAGICLWLALIVYAARVMWHLL